MVCCFSCFAGVEFSQHKGEDQNCILLGISELWTSGWSTIGIIKWKGGGIALSRDHQTILLSLHSLPHHFPCSVWNAFLQESTIQTNFPPPEDAKRWKLSETFFLRIKGPFATPIFKPDDLPWSPRVRWSNRFVPDSKPSAHPTEQNGGQHSPHGQLEACHETWPFAYSGPELIGLDWNLEKVDLKIISSRELLLSSWRNNGRYLHHSSSWTWMWYGVEDGIELIHLNHSLSHLLLLLLSK